MQNDNLSLPIWGRSALPPNTCPYYEFGFDQPPPPSLNSNYATTVLIEAQNLHISGENKKAADLLITIVQQEDLARPVLLDCLVKLKDAKTLLSYFDPPVNEAEAIHVMDALWDGGRRDRLSEVIATPLIAGSTDPSVVEIRNKYSARLR